LSPSAAKTYSFESTGFSLGVKNPLTETFTLLAVEETILYPSNMLTLRVSFVAGLV